MTVLLVDDEKQVLDGMLHGIDFDALGLDTVLTARSGEEAKEIILRQPVDILVCDIEMADLSGLGLLEWIRDENYPIRTIFCTAFRRFDYAKKALELHAFDYFLKPIRYDELSRKLAAAMDTEPLIFKPAMSPEQPSEASPRKIRTAIQTDDGFYALVDESFSPILHAEVFTAAGITLGEDGQPKTLLDGVCCTLHWTGLGTGIVTVDRKDIRLGETAIYLGGILLLCGIAIGFCSYLIYYFRHYIAEPLQFFQNHVNDYLKERRFTKRYGFAELDEVENAFSALETQVEELKIDIYEEKLRRTRTELEFLQNQIKPHFFVNCFNIIIGMAEWERFDQIQDFCMLLSSYVRYTLCDGFETVSLKEELEQSRDFLEIQNIRFDTAATLCELSEEAGNASLEFAQVPPMTILSFVENSIKHNKFKVDDLKMQVSIRHIPGGLNGLWEILFADNGVGLDAAQCAGMREMLDSIREDVLGKGENVAFSGEQIGIQNVYRRMLLLFGERARMELVSNPGEGFAVKVTIPSIEKKTPAIKDK